MSTADKEEGHSKAGEATRTAGTGNRNGGDGTACAWEAATTKGMAWPASPVATGCQGNPCSTGIRWGVSPAAQRLFAQQEREPIRGRPTVKGKRTYGGRPGQRVEEQGTWASRTQNHSEAGYGRPVDRGAWTAKTVKRPRQQPAHPQYANYWAPLTRKRHTMPHSAQPQHTRYWAPRTRKRHQQEHRPQRQHRPTESSNPTQHAKGRTGDCPGPVKEQQPDGMSHRGVLVGPKKGRLFKVDFPQPNLGSRSFSGWGGGAQSPKTPPPPYKQCLGGVRRRISTAIPPPPR